MKQTLVNNKIVTVNRSNQYSNQKSTTRINQSSTRDIDRFGGLDSNQSGSLSTLTQLRKYILPMINVGTLGKVVTVDKIKGIINVKPFPLLDSENQKNINCQCLCYRDIKKVDVNCPALGGNTEDVNIEWEWKSLIEQIEVNDIVCIVFMDRNFVQNLKQSKLGSKLSNLNDEQKYHSDSYGIIIGIVNKYNMNI